MKLHARFPTRLRGQDVEAEINADFEPGRETVLRVEFTRHGVPVDLGQLTRTELAALCREAARHSLSGWHALKRPEEPTQ